jgi:hypothetical protein
MLVGKDMYDELHLVKEHEVTFMPVLVVPKVSRGCMVAKSQ